MDTSLLWWKDLVCADEFGSSAGNSVFYQKGHTCQTGLHGRARLNICINPLNMVRKQKKNPILDLSSLGSTMTSSNIRFPWYPLTSEQQDLGSIIGQPKLSPVGLLEEQEPQRRQKYSVFENPVIMACCYKSEPTRWVFLKQIFEL